MRFIVLFTDNPELAVVRQEKMHEHLAFLERHRESVLAAGPLTDAADGSPAGGLWLVEADHPEAVASLYCADPFWPTGLRASVRVLRWSQVFADGRRLVGD